jgi:hypothetical protein
MTGSSQATQNGLLYCLPQKRWQELFLHRGAGRGSRRARAGRGLRWGPNKGLELTASSVRSYLAPASGSSSGLALGVAEDDDD